jgi:predicted O-linked N-acetylglucosamine transferase (SPINDLY family)
LGDVWHALGRHDDAVQAYRTAISVKPDLGEAFSHLGNCLVVLESFDDAFVALEQATELLPRDAEAKNNLGNALKGIGEIDQAIGFYRQAIELDGQAADIHSNLILTMNYSAHCTAADIVAEQARWATRHERTQQADEFPRVKKRDASGKLRIGYLSPDLRDHVVGRNLWPLFREHDHAGFSIICYCNARTSDRMSEQFKSCSDAWRSIRFKDDASVARMIREDEIDILVDLSLHSRGNRLPLFSMKPAPVQISFAGYPGGAGLAAIDFRLSDPFLDPPDEAPWPGIEQVLPVLRSFWCYDPQVNGATGDDPVNSLPAQDAKFVTFGCLNHFCKVNDDVLALWAQVLVRVPLSRFLLMAPNGPARRRVINRFERAGVAAERIAFVPRQKRDDYRNTYRRIDLCLDTFPYNGHSTSLDAFWMGVPVVTIKGNTIVGRAGVSQLTNLELTDLIAATPAEFVQIAETLAADLARLGDLRMTLRQRMLDSPLTDCRQFARSIESAYRIAYSLKMNAGARQ